MRHVLHHIGVSLAALFLALTMAFCAAPAYAKGDDAVCTFLANMAGKSVVLKAEGVPLVQVLASVEAMPDATWGELKADIAQAVRFGYSGKAADPYEAAQFVYQVCMQPKV